MKINPLIKKNLLPLFLVVNIFSCNDNNVEKNTPSAATNKTESYYLPVPTGWTKELISFPIDFAPGIPYKGTEDLRFAKGWADIISDEHWCYAFAWWLDGKPVIDETTLQQNLTEYYSGLVKRNVIDKKIPESKTVPTVATIKKMVTLRGDRETYTGIIQLLDYHSETPMVLNCMIHVKSCDTKSHTALLFEISPKPLDHPVWKQLNGLNESFNCGN